MNENTQAPSDRIAFDSAMQNVLTEHAMLRRLAVSASSRSGFSADAAMSLADAMTTHESTEARLFALPFLTRPPKSVTATAARAHQRCHEYTSGDYRGNEPSTAATLFADALLAHLDAEEAWLDREKDHQNERLSISA